MGVHPMLVIFAMKRFFQRSLACLYYAQSSFKDIDVKVNEKELQH